jgi:hypothetical protein
MARASITAMFATLRAGILNTIGLLTTRPSAINTGSPRIGVAMRAIGISFRIELCSTLTFRNRLKLNNVMSNAHQSGLASTRSINRKTGFCVPPISATSEMCYTALIALMTKNMNMLIS